MSYCISYMINKMCIRDRPPEIHKPFSEKEIEVLFAHDNIPFVDTILIMIYTGFRVSELFQIKTKDVDLQNLTIRGGKDVYKRQGSWVV